MTGAVNWETLQWLAVLIAGLISGAIATGDILWRYQSWLNGEFEKRDSSRSTELEKRDLATQAETARAKMAEEEIRRTLEAHKLFAAEHFATEEGVSKAMEPILRAIDRLTDRLDRLLPDLPRQQPRTRQ